MSGADPDAPVQAEEVPPPAKKQKQVRVWVDGW